MPSTRWSRSCWGPTSSAASSACRKPCVRRPTVAIRWSSRYNDPRDTSRERLIDAGAVLDHPDAEQRGLRRSAVPVVVGLFLVFGLVRIPTLAHGAFFMLGAYFGYTLLQLNLHFWPAALVGGLGVGLIGILMERFVLRRLAGNEQGQVLVTLGVSFIIADICLLVWTGDPMPLPAPQALRPPLRFAGFAFPTYRLVVLGIALVAALALYLLMERTRLGAMIRAGVDDMEMARGVGIPVSRLFTTVFLLGATLAGIGG